MQWMSRCFAPLAQWSSLLLGLAESLAYGWYVALIFGPLFNVFALNFEK
jgi:hypothetical protein